MANPRHKVKARLHYRLNTFVFIGIFLMVELAAFNTSENLFYLLAAFVLCFPILALIASRTAFGRIDVDRHAPESVHRHEPFDVSVRLQNRKRFVPGVSLRMSLQSGAATAYVPVLPAGVTATLALPMSMPRRGVHRLPALEVRSAFPMAFVERSRRIDDGLEVVVYPAVHRVDRSALERLDDSGNRPRPTQATGDEFYALREYVPGDDIRLICWRVSARVGELIVRDLEPSSARSVAIIVDSRGFPRNQAAEDAFELAVELAASLAVAFLDRQYSVALVTPQGTVPLGQGEGQVLRALELLARVAPVGYEVLGDDWYRGSGDMAGATKLFIATDAARWGSQGIGGSVRVLDPVEVLHAT